MVVPGFVLDTWSSGSTMMVSIRYWYRKDIETGAWSIYPRTNQDPLVMKMDSALLHARPPEAGKIMLVPQIMNGKYQNIASWYDKHKRACMDLEREGQKKKEEAEIKARMALQAAAIEAKKKQETDVLQALANVITSLETLSELTKHTPAASDFPNCLLLHRDLYVESTKNYENTVVADRIGPWGRSTQFQTELIKGLTKVSQLNGGLLSTGHTLMIHTNRNARDMIKNNDEPRTYTTDEWRDMTLDVPIADPFKAFVKEMTHIQTDMFRRTDRQTNQHTNEIRMFMVLCFAFSMSGIKFRHPVEIEYTKDLLQGDCERQQITTMVKKYAFGVSPVTAEHVPTSSGVLEQAKQFYLPLDFEVYPKSKLADMFKLLTDNFGQKAQGGKFMTGCTTMLLTRSNNEYSNPEFTHYLESCSREEIPMSNTGIESPKDIVAASVDVFCQMFVLFNIMHIASLRDQIKAAKTHGQYRTNLKDYANKRLNNFSEDQSHRKSRHRTPINGEVVDVTLSPFYYPQTEDDVVEATRGSEAVWARMARPVTWGFDGFGNKVQHANLDKFFHMYYKEGQERTRIVTDPLSPTAPLVVASGDATPVSRFKRLLAMQRKLVASGKGDALIGWGSPLEKEQKIDPAKDTITWTSADAVEQVAHIGDRLTYTGFENKFVVLVADNADGTLLVVFDSEEQSIDASLFKKWCPGTGDKHESLHEFYQYIRNIIGLFHVLMSALKRSMSVNRKTLKILIGLYRSYGQVEFMLGAGRYEICYSEMGAVVTGIMSLTEYVYRSYCASTNEQPTPEGQANWMNKLRNTSGDWNQLFNICDIYFAIKALQDATRSADMEVIVLALGKFVELFALVGARTYFHLVTEFLLKQKTMSPYELALQIRLLTERFGLVFRPNDRFVENMQGASAHGRSSTTHGLIHAVRDMKRSFEQLQMNRPNLGGASKSKPPTAQLGSLKVDFRITSMIVTFLEEESGLTNLNQGALNKITGHLIFDDPDEDFVYDFSGQKIVKHMQNVEDVARVAAHALWTKTVFDPKCNEVTMVAVPDLLSSRLVVAAEETAYQNRLIKMITLDMWNALVDKPKPTVWQQHIKLIMNAMKDANRGQYTNTPPPSLQVIANLPLTGTGSRETNDMNRDKFRKWVPPGTVSEIVGVRLLCKIKNLGLRFATEVLEKHYATDHSNLIERVKDMHGGPLGMKARRAAALKEIKEKDLQLEYKPITKANVVHKAEQALFRFFRERPTQPQPQATTLRHLKQATKSLLISFESRRGWGNKQKPLGHHRVQSLSNASDILTSLLRMEPAIYSRTKQMSEREKEKDLECMELSKISTRSAAEWAGKTSRWDDDNNAIPLSASVKQSMKQAHREGQKALATAAAASATAAAAATAQQRTIEEAKKKKIAVQTSLKELGGAALISLGKGPKALTKKYMQSLVENWSPVVSDTGDLQLNGTKKKVKKGFDTFKATKEGKAMMKAGIEAFKEQKRVQEELKQEAKERKEKEAKERKGKEAKERKEKEAKERKEKEQLEMQHRMELAELTKQKEVAKKSKKRKAEQERLQAKAKTQHDKEESKRLKSERREATIAKRAAATNK